MTVVRCSSYHRDRIVKQRLSKHQDVQQLVDVDFLEHGQNRHRVHGRDDGAKQQAGQQANMGGCGGLNLAHGEHHPADEEGVPQRPHHREDQDGAHVLGEGPDGQEVAGVEDDGRQQVEEEELGVHDRRLLLDRFDGAANKQTDEDQQAALWNDVGNSGNDVETFRRTKIGFS